MVVYPYIPTHNPCQIFPFGYPKCNSSPFRHLQCWFIDALQYQIEELFAANVPEENRSLLALQSMPMAQRRHAVVVLVGDSYVTFNPMQALQLSAHAVLNRSEMFLLIQLLQKIVADNDLFYKAYRSAQNRVHETKE